MRPKRMNTKQLNIPLYVVILATVLVFMITSVNVFVVHVSMKNLVEEYMDVQLNAHVYHMEENVVRLKNKAATTEVLVAETRNDEELLDVLAEARENSALYRFFYLKNTGILLDDMHGSNPEGYDFSLITGIRDSLYEDNFYCFPVSITDPQTGEKSVYAAGAVRDYSEEGLRGYLILLIPFDEMMEREHFDELDTEGYGCLADGDGYVYLSSDRLLETIPGTENIFDAILSRTDQRNASVTKINQMRRYLSASDHYSISCKGENGKQVLVKGFKVDGISNLYMVTVFEDGVMDRTLMPIMLICFITCLAIVMVLFVVILLQLLVNYRNTVRMEELAYTDAVTGGYNQNYFKIRAPELIAENSESHYLIVRFDIVNFRYINEAYGHDSADKILRSISEKFEEVYTKRELIAHINSDQFLALVLNDTDKIEKNRHFEKIISDHAKEEGVKYPVRFKKGIYQVRKEDKNIDIMIDHANAARKSLFGDEKELEALYSDNIVREMKKNDAIVSDMQPAIAKGEFKPYLQPKWDIVNDRIVGAEVLVRWIKADGSMVYPSDFIPIFEQNGFIEKLDFYMLEHLCEKIREYKEKGGYKIVPISINQSRILLSNPEYLKNVERILERYEMALEDVQIEITESVFLNDREKMISVTDQLKEMGLMLCMDDFGSGYSSLNMLKDVPFDILKIDKDFFSEVDTSRDTKIIMQHIVGMATELGIKVVCEGVETDKQIKMLTQIGCTMVQGYYYDKPIPFDDFMEKYLRDDVYGKTVSEVRKINEQRQTES